MRRPVAALLTILLASPAAAADRPLEIVHFGVASAAPRPLQLEAQLRRPDGAGPFAAVVLLHGCEGMGGSESDWARRLADWGYATLAVDSYGPREIANTCQSTPPADRAVDAYGALDFLARQPYVSPDRIALMGFATGAVVALTDVEDGLVERLFSRKFRAVVAFYPACAGFTGTMTAPTLILIGALDDWASADACREMMEGQGDMGVSRPNGLGAGVRLVILPDARHGFDDAARPPRRVYGHRLEYNAAATDRAGMEIRDFLRQTLGE